MAKNPNFQGKIWQEQGWEKLNRKLNFFKLYLFVQHRFVVPSDVHPFFQAESVLSASFIDDSECRIITSFTAITWTASVFSQVLVNCTRSRAPIKVLMDPSRVMNGGFTDVHGITASTDKLVHDIGFILFRHGILGWKILSNFKGQKSDLGFCSFAKGAGNFVKFSLKQLGNFAAVWKFEVPDIRSVIALLLFLGRYFPLTTCFSMKFLTTWSIIKRGNEFFRRIL